MADLKFVLGIVFKIREPKLPSPCQIIETVQWGLCMSINKLKLSAKREAIQLLK
jgi:hypothetical protein